MSVHIETTAGNMAAMREALEKVNEIYDILSKPCIVAEEARQACREARGVLIPALAAPPRNCDVGTADEQLPRFVAAWESAHRSFVDRRSMMMLSVFSRWAQMPYVEKEGEDNDK